MYLVYVDESGDPGFYDGTGRNGTSRTRYFILSALIVHESKWIEVMESHIQLRKKFRSDPNKKLLLKSEIHAGPFITARDSKLPHNISNIKKHHRYNILRETIKWTSGQPIQTFSVVIDKLGKDSDYDVFEKAWVYLIQRLDNTAQRKNFLHYSSQSTPEDNKVLLIADNTDGLSLNKILRRMRAYNPIPSKIGYGFQNKKVEFVLEDCWMKNSSESYLEQVVDVISFFLKQWIQPCGYVRKKGGRRAYTELENVIIKHVSSKNNWGVVYY